jgi:hypothetical protein
MSPEQLQEQLTNEVATLRDLAVKSSDPLIVAKAIAASNEGVQQLLLAKFGAGDRLVEVFALQGSSLSEIQVFFRFVPATEVAHLVNTGVLAFVDLGKGEVIGTVDPFTLQPERRVGRPFVTVAALKAFADSQTTKPLVERERAFFRSVGLGGGGLGGLEIDTVTDTETTSTTYSGQPYRPDDTGKETCTDYVDCGGPIWGPI